jgi:hypothetical protein
MAHEFVELFKSIFVKEQINALSGSELARFVLSLATLWPASRFGLRIQLTEFFHAVMMIAERL